MITAVDTTVLLDVLIPDAPHPDTSERALADGLRAGAVVISGPAYAQVAVHFPDRMDLRRFLADTGIRLVIGAHALFHADRLLTRDGATTANTSPSWSWF